MAKVFGSCTRFCDTICPPSFSETVPCQTHNLKPHQKQRGARQCRTPAAVFLACLCAGFPACLYAGAPACLGVVFPACLWACLVLLELEPPA